MPHEQTIDGPLPIFLLSLDDKSRQSIADEMERLRLAADHICEQLDPQTISGAINWGDLGCVAANFCIDNEGSIWRHVVIEEASPDETQLQIAISAALQRAGWGDVGVITCW